MVTARNKMNNLWSFFPMPLRLGIVESYALGNTILWLARIIRWENEWVDTTLGIFQSREASHLNSSFIFWLPGDLGQRKGAAKLLMIEWP